MIDKCLLDFIFFCCVYACNCDDTKCLRLCLKALSRKRRWRMGYLSSVHTRYHNICMSNRGPKSCELLYYPFALCVNTAQENKRKELSRTHKFENNQLIVPNGLCRLNYILGFFFVLIVTPNQSGLPLYALSPGSSSCLPDSE